VLKIRQIPHNRPLLCARVNQAHNDYLQLLVETGLAGFSIAV
jgi:O-antigen ligase